MPDPPTYRNSVVHNHQHGLTVSELADNDVSTGTRAPYEQFSSRPSTPSHDVMAAVRNQEIDGLAELPVGLNGQDGMFQLKHKPEEEEEEEENRRRVSELPACMIIRI